MDKRTRIRYMRWRRKRIFKRVVTFGAVLSILLIGTNWIFGLLPDDEDEQGIINATNLEVTRVNIAEEELEDSCGEIDFSPIVQVLERYASDVAIYFENLESGCTFEHNAQEEFFAASLKKAPFALWIYQKAELGIVNLEERLVFTEEVFAGGSGVIRLNYEFGATFSVEELLGLNLYESDNVATRMLHQRFSQDAYVRFVENIGGRRELIGDILGSLITANEAGLFAREIYEYITSGSSYSQIFRQQLLNNQHQFIMADYPIASKTGWYRHYGGAWHDMAIIFAPSPFTLVILSSDKTGTAEDFNVFQAITDAFIQFNHINFGLSE